MRHRSPAWLAWRAVAAIGSGVAAAAAVGGSVGFGAYAFFDTASTSEGEYQGAIGGGIVIGLLAAGLVYLIVAVVLIARWTPKAQRVLPAMVVVFAPLIAMVLVMIYGTVTAS